MNILVFIGNLQKMQQLTTFIQQISQPQNNDNENWCGRGGGISNASCSTNANKPMSCFKETWKLDGEMSRFN